MLDPDPVVRTKSGFRIAPATQVPSGVRVTDDVIVLIGRGAVIDGGVYLAGSLATQPRVEVHGPVRANGRVVLGAGSVVAGGIDAQGDVRILPGATVHGDLDAIGDVHLFDGAIVHGRVTSGGDIVVWGGAETGRMRPGGRIRTEPFPQSQKVEDPPVRDGTEDSPMVGPAEETDAEDPAAPWLTEASE